eukprot:m.54702 g.54702  ORF g.54702 m.54702 type:complete len:347 (+) comp48790_c0_seq1:136-1176(+)
MPPKPAAKAASKAPPQESELTVACKKLSEAYVKRTIQAKERPQPPHPAIELAIKTALKEMTPLDKLTFEQQAFVGPFDSSSLEPFFDTLRDTGYALLTSISFLRCGLRNMDIMVLSQFLEQKSLLTKLELVDCSLSLFACSRLGEAIGPNRFLTHVILDYNRFGSEGARALSVGLSLNPKLAVVSMNNCDIGPEAGEPIGNTLAHAMWLELHLNNNRLGCVGGASLVKGLATNTSLKLLSLQANAIEPTGSDISGIKTFFLSVSGAVATNTSLLGLDLNDNLIGDVGGEEVLAIYKARAAASQPGLNIRVTYRMATPSFEEISKQTKWPIDDEGKSKKKKAAKKKK